MRLRQLLIEAQERNPDLDWLIIIKKIKIVLISTPIGLLRAEELDFYLGCPILDVSLLVFNEANNKL